MQSRGHTAEGEVVAKWQSQPIPFLFFFFFLFSRPVHFKSSEHKICRKLCFYICAKVARSRPPLKRRLLKCFYYPVVSRALYFFFFYHLALINNVCNLQRFRKDTQQQQHGDKHAWHREACQHHSIRRHNMGGLFFFPHISLWNYWSNAHFYQPESFLQETDFPR